VKLAGDLSIRACVSSAMHKMTSAATAVVACYLEVDPNFDLLSRLPLGTG
jgi:hypothetical protein